VAASYPEDRIDEAAAIIGQCPGVSHNYRRNHAFNLWYTVSVPPNEALEDLVNRLRIETEADQTLLLPTIRRFKLAVRLGLSRDPDPALSAEAGDTPDQRLRYAPLSPMDMRAVRALQDDFPLDPEPFRVLAAREGLEPGALLQAARGLHTAGALRRLAATLRHREAGFRANGMVVWQAADAQCSEAGVVMARFAEVSHCYQRPTYPDWPYNLYTMIHAREEAQVEASAVAISAATGLRTYEILYSTTEYKKRRSRYFTDEWETWKQRYMAIS
jgi:DNA-binding Lrp family transcriptional regulator